MHDRFLRACRGEPTDVTPVWFMRQAGRYMPEYLALREKHSMLEICRTPELALQVTLQPLRLGVDAAILFSDILLPINPMGPGLEFVDGRGPVVARPVRDGAAIAALQPCDPEEHLGYVLDAVRLIRRELDGKTPLIGFAGGPFTIVSYLVEGGKSSDYRHTKRLMWSEPRHWDALMRHVSEVVRRLLRAEVEAGAQAVQLFDSWAGALTVADYVRYVQPYVREVLQDVEQLGVPVIHFGTQASHLLEQLRDAGGTVMGVDWRLDLATAWERVGWDMAIQGNLDPVALCASSEVAVERAEAVLKAAAGRPGHIFNLGHGVLPQTPVDAVKAVVDAVHGWRGTGENMHR